MADVATIVDENVNGVRVVEVLRRRASARSTSWPTPHSGCGGPRSKTVDDPGPLRAAHGEPPAPRPRRRAAVRRLARHRRPDHHRRAGRLQRLRRDDAGAVPLPRLHHDARPAGGGLGRADLRDPRRAPRDRRPARRRRPRRTRRARSSSATSLRLPPTGRGDRTSRPLALRPARANPARPSRSSGARAAGSRRSPDSSPASTTSTTARCWSTAHDVRDLTVHSLRHHVGVVLDEPFLFSVSIRDNIAYARPDASLDEIVAAATAAQAHEFIGDLPDGYDTVIGERGYDLSGGQRQRIAIARTLLVNPPHPRARRRDQRDRRAGRGADPRRAAQPAAPAAPRS